jgi:hypothetical protein
MPDLPPQLRDWTNFAIRTGFKVAGLIATYHLALDDPASPINHTLASVGLK